jgi:hypothetical protein
MWERGEQWIQHRLKGREMGERKGEEGERRSVRANI